MWLPYHTVPSNKQKLAYALDIVGIFAQADLVFVNLSDLLCSDL
jgi:hypothetical protein